MIDYQFLSDESVRYKSREYRTDLKKLLLERSAIGMHARGRRKLLEIKKSHRTWCGRHEELKHPGGCNMKS